MEVKINIENFEIKHYPNHNEIDLTESFNEVTELLTKVLHNWNEVQCMTESIIKVNHISSLSLKAVAEILISMADKAIENEHFAD